MNLQNFPLKILGFIRKNLSESEKYNRSFFMFQKFVPAVPRQGG